MGTLHVNAFFIFVNVFSEHDILCTVTKTPNFAGLICARPEKRRAHMHHLVTMTTLACWYARGSHLKGHMERTGRALALSLNQEKETKF